MVNIRNEFFATLVKAREDTNFSESTKIAERKIIQYELWNSAAARKLFLKQEHKNDRICYAL